MRIHLLAVAALAVVALDAGSGAALAALDAVAASRPYYGGNVSTASNEPLAHEFVTALVKGRRGSMAILGGDATAGRLRSMYDGPRPPPASAGPKPHDGYRPMRKEGAIVLGVGGDNARDAVGIFYEGVMTKGASTAAADEEVQANVVAAGYGSGDAAGGA